MIYILLKYHTLYLNWRSSNLKFRIGDGSKWTIMVYYMVGRDAYIIWFYSKHRKKVLYGRLKAGVRDIISTLCRYKDVEIIDGAECEDYIHLSVTMPLKYSISKFRGYLKDKSTLMIYDRHPNLQSKWDKAFWAREYYISTIDNIIEDATEKYIRE